VQRAVGGGHAQVELGRGLLGRPAGHVPQDQHRPLRRGQVLQRGQERQLDGLPGRDRSAGLVLGRGGRLQQAIGERLQPRDVRAGRQGRARIRRRPQVRGQDPPGAPVDRIEAGVGGDPVEPGPQRRAALEPGEVAPGAQERLLHQVLGVLDRAEHPVAVHPQLAPVRLHQLGERGFVPAAGGG
jgi:hypothetical protein